jgi:hypothetical protein
MLARIVNVLAAENESFRDQFRSTSVAVVRRLEQRR